MSGKTGKKKNFNRFVMMDDTEFDLLYEQIILKYPNGCTCSEIAKTFKLSPPTIRSALKEIHKKLYKLLKKEGVTYRRD